MNLLRAIVRIFRPDPKLVVRHEVRYVAATRSESASVLAKRKETTDRLKRVVAAELDAKGVGR